MLTRANRSGPAVVVVLLAVACGLPSSAAAQTASQDSVTGTSLIFAPDSPVGALRNAFDARSGPSGQDPSGTVRVSFGGFDETFEVTCLAVSGNRAVIGF